jgi:MaoC like domain
VLAITHPCADAPVSGRPPHTDEFEQVYAHVGTDAVPARIRCVSVRFSRPVIPGKTLRVEIFARAPPELIRARR